MVCTRYRVLDDVLPSLVSALYLSRSLDRLYTIWSAKSMRVIADSCLTARSQHLRCGCFPDSPNIAGRRL